MSIKFTCKEGYVERCTKATSKDMKLVRIYHIFSIIRWSRL